MGRLSYEDWVPKEDRNRFSRIGQTIGELENNPVCREASSTLFWQVFFGLKGLSAVIEIERRAQAMEKTGYSFNEALNALAGEENIDKDTVLIALIRREKSWQLIPPSLVQFTWIGLDPAILDRVFNVLLGLNRESVTSVKGGGQDRLLAVAFTQLHLATALLRAVSKISWGSPEVAEDLISLGERAFWYIREHNELYAGSLFSERQALQFLAQAGYVVNPVASNEMNTTTFTELPKSPLQAQREESLSAVICLFLNEQFKADRKSGRNEEALSSFAMAVALWAGSTSSLEGELSVQDAVDCCESIFLNKSAVRDWESVANSCCLIVDNLSQFPDSDDLALHDVSDSQGWSWGVVYWQRASTRAENEMSPSQFKQVLDVEKRSSHINRLVNDFLEDLFVDLEPDSREALIQAEMNWYESRAMGGRVIAAANELRHVFEHELRSLIFKPLRESIDQMLQDQSLRNELRIKSKRAKGLNLTEMAILLKEAGKTSSLMGLPIRQMIEDFPVGQEDKIFLYVHLPTYLSNLIFDARNPSEHPAGVSKKELERRIKDMRRIALGIGSESYIVHLLKIKKVVMER